MQDAESLRRMHRQNLNQCLISTSASEDDIDKTHRRASTVPSSPHIKIETRSNRSLSFDRRIATFRNRPRVFPVELYHASINSSRELVQNVDSDSSIDKSKLMGMWSAGFTIINIYLGLALLSYPYAIYQGGLIFSFVILAVLSAFMSWTGKLLVRCFARMKESKRTYSDVGYAAFGTCGVYLVSIGVVLEFFGMVDTNLVFFWDNVQYFIDSLKFDDVDIGNIGMLPFITSAVVLPTCWLLNISDLSFVSLLGCVSKVLTVLAIVLCFFLNIDTVSDNWKNGKIALYPKDVQSLSICMGIFMVSLAGAPVLPTVYNSMKDPDRFEVLLDRCFLCLFVIYCTMGLCGFLQFGDDTEVVITSNLIQLNTDGKGSRFEMVICQILLVFIVSGLYFQISPLLSILAEIPEMRIFKIESKWKQQLFRTILFLFCVVSSYVMMNDLAVLEAVTGSMCSMITTVIAPALFYFALYSNTLTNNLRVILICAACLGILFGLFLLFNDIRTLLD